MLKEFYNYKTIFIEKKFKNHKNVEKILSRLNPEETIYIDDVKDTIDKLNSKNIKDNKNLLFLGGIRGEILQTCPGSHGHICCNYNVINLYIGCPLGCHYCILQSYLNQPFTIINIDIETIFKNIEEILKKERNKIFRIGTGELSDSLVFDPITDFSVDFVNFFKNQPNAIFELKTKTNFIENLLKIEAGNNIVIGFSVNPEETVSQIEGISAPIEKRIESIEKLIKKGYKIALHFDPIININNFDILYMTLIEKLFKVIPIEKIAWLSMGTLRFTKSLKNEIEYNYPDSLLLSDEFFENMDKKYRYFKPIRITLYQKVRNWIKKYDEYDKIPIYLCMESPSVWQEVLEKRPESGKNLELLFK